MNEPYYMTMGFTMDEKFAAVKRENAADMKEHMRTKHAAGEEKRLKREE